MKTKTDRKTKKSVREQAEKAALRQRVRDIAVGATGFNFDAPDEFATADQLSRIVPALQVTFATEGRDYMWKPHCLDRFNDIDSTTEFLWSHGVRA